MKPLRARLQGRPGPAPLQPYRDLAKLWRKESLLPDGVTPIAVVAPGIALGVALTLAAALPLAAPGIPPLGEIVALVFLLALSRFALGLAALDSRSAFAGMAASREQTVAALVEPALLLALLGAAALGRGTRCPRWRTCRSVSPACSPSGLFFWCCSRRRRAFRSTIKRRTTS